MGTTLFKTRKCEIVYPVKTEDPENDTLTVGTAYNGNIWEYPPPPGALSNGASRTFDSSGTRFAKGQHEAGNCAN